MKTIRLTLAAAMAWTACRAPAAAAGRALREDLDFFAAEAPVVVTASLRPERLDQVPGTMTVITAADIRALGLDTLSHAFNLIPGFEMTQESFGPVVPVVRGYKFATGHLKLMIDGHAVNAADHKDLDAWLDMPLDGVAQVEVIRGPGSALYGTDAFFAVVNVITRKSAGGSASAGVGSFGRWSANAVLNGDPARPVTYRFNFNQSGERGDKHTYVTDWLSGSPYAAQSRAPMTKRKPAARVEAGAVLGAGGFTVTARHAQLRREWSEGYLNVMTPGRSFVTSRTNLVEAAYAGRVGEDAELAVKASFDEDDLKYEGQFLPPYFSWAPAPSATFGPQGAVYQSWKTGHRYETQAMLSAPLGRHSLTAGVEYGHLYFPESRTRRNYQRASLMPIPGGLTEYGGRNPENWNSAEHTSEDRWGAFGQDIVDLRPVTLILGARYDKYQLAGAAFSPRAAAVYDAPWGQILKASLGHAFYAPTSSSRYTQTLGFAGNPDLRPQVVRTVEASVQNAFAARAHYALAAFHSRISDGFTFDSSRPVAYSNEADIRIAGAEIEGRWDWGPRSRLWGNYSYNRKRMRGAPSAVVFPEHVANVGVQVEASRRVGVSLRSHMAGRTGRGPGLGHVAGWATLDAAVNWALGGGWDLQLAGRNLLDQQIRSHNDQGFFPGSSLRTGNDFPWGGRQVLFKSTYRWGERK